MIIVNWLIYTIMNEERGRRFLRDIQFAFSSAEIEKETPKEFKDRMNRFLTDHKFRGTAQQQIASKNRIFVNVNRHRERLNPRRFEVIRTVIARKRKEIKF